MGVYVADLYVPVPSSLSVAPVKATLYLIGVDCSLGMRIEDCCFNGGFPLTRVSKETLQEMVWG
jgi:hypothetical protein